MKHEQDKNWVLSGNKLVDSEIYARSTRVLPSPIPLKS